MEQGFVSSGQTYHSFVYSHISVGVQLHRLTYHVCALGSVARKKSHLIHSIKELSVRRLEAVYLGNSSRDDDAHYVGHIVFFDSVGNKLILYRRDYRRLSGRGAFFALLSHLCTILNKIILFLSCARRLLSYGCRAQVRFRAVGEGARK